jgi:D-serine deaminase-like pyridoxal phosphate-dependent protein
MRAGTPITMNRVSSVRPAPAAFGDPVEAVDTPALLVELDAFERNLVRMAEFARAKGLRLRPHGKTHKCVAIARAQIHAGAVGVCCQKVSEAEAFVAGGVEDVLVSNEIIAPAKLRRLAALTARARIGVCVDHPQGLEALVAAAADAAQPIDVYIELDVGGGRCGIEEIEDGLRLMDRIVAARNLTLAGIQAYQGSAQHLRKPAQRKAAIEEAVRRVIALRDALVRQGASRLIVTGAGTGSFYLEAASGAYDEIQPGSYIFMDRDYGENEWAAESGRFENSLFLLTTVMSRRSGHAVVDAGHKAHGIDTGMPTIAGRPDLIYDHPSDEHGQILPATAQAALPELGQPLRLIPGHCDPTVNLHDWLVGIRQGHVEALWPVEARGAFS